MKIHFLLIKTHTLRVTEIRTRIVCQSAHLPFQFVGLPQIIGIDECDPFPDGMLHTEVTAGCLTEVGTTEDPDYATKRFGDGSGIVGRTVVDDENLARGEGLLKNAVESRFEKTEAL